MEPSAHTRSTVQVADIPDVDLSAVGSHKFGSFEVEVVDYTAEYFATLKVRWRAPGGGVRTRPCPQPCAAAARPGLPRL
jgi:hypothetical protein